MKQKSMILQKKKKMNGEWKALCSKLNQWIRCAILYLVDILFKTPYILPLVPYGVLYYGE